jgi:serine/threonine protein kinase
MTVDAKKEFDDKTLLKLDEKDAKPEHLFISRNRPFHVF